MLAKFYIDAVKHFELREKVETEVTKASLNIASTDELSKAIQTLSQQFPRNDSTAISDLRHNLVVKQLVTLLGTKRIPAKNRAAIFVIEGLVSNTVNNIQAKPHFLKIYYALLLSWIQVSVHDPSKSIGDGTSFPIMLDKINTLSLKIDQFSGEVGSQHCKFLLKTFLHFSGDKTSTADDLYSEIQKQERLFNKQRRQYLVNNIKAYKKKTAKKTAKTIVSTEIRRSIGDGLYPIILLEFVENYYTLFLEKHFILHGANGDVWNETHKNLSYLIWAFRAEVDMKYHRYFPENIPPALDSIVEKVDPFVTDKKKLYQDFLAMEETLKIRKRDGFIKLDCVFNVTELSADSLYTNLASKWRKEYSSASQWYSVQHKSKEACCKLISQDIFKKQIVFANYSGSLQVIYDTSEPSFQIEQIRAIAVNTETDSDYILSDIDYQITNLHADFCDQYQDVITQIDVDIAAKLKLQHEREKQLQIKNRLAKERREQEKQKIAQEKEQAKTKLREQQRANKIKRKELEINIAKVHIGTLITATLEDGTVASMELNVITSTTNRYIFNDKTCQHKLAVTKDKLLDMLVAGKLSIDVLGRAKGANQNLEGIIADRREHLDSR